MICNAIDEVLFWDELDVLKDFYAKSTALFFPHDPKGATKFYLDFIKNQFPTKEDFIVRFERYAEVGGPLWIAGRNQFCDDIDRTKMLKAIKYSSITNGEERAKRASSIWDRHTEIDEYYSNSILYAAENHILELTIGAGGGTTAVMRSMKANDYYMGVDIDFVCAKNADAIAKYYGVNGLGIASSLWNLPFEDGVFTSICCSNGLGECREVPTILKEAARVLAPGGRMILRLEFPAKAQRRNIFDLYDFTGEERSELLRKVRMYADYEQIEELLCDLGLKKLDILHIEGSGHVIVFEK